MCTPADLTPTPHRIQRGDRLQPGGFGAQMLPHREALARQRGLKKRMQEATFNAAPFYRACLFARGEAATYHSPRGIALTCVLMSEKPHF